MRRHSVIVSALVGALVTWGLASLSACGSTQSSGFGTTSSGGGSGGGNSSGGGNGSGSGGGSGGSSGANGSSGGFDTDGGFPGSSSSGTTVYGDGGIACPPGLTCNVSCSGGTATTITGKVYDPAGKNAIYNVAVYVPATSLQPLPKGVPTGSDACSCSALFKSGAITSATTDVDGSFTLTNAPTGTNVPLVLQVGKWRTSTKINVTACQDNAQPDKSLKLPGSVQGPDDNLPDIAVSTGALDTLECLMRRIGLPTTEYVAGTGTSGHVHVFSGGNPGAGGKGGAPELNKMAGAPESDTSLWSDVSHLMPFDITLLSCEGDETYNAKPDVLEQYLNAGGRAFASHFHYAWFAGPIGTMQGYSAPTDWGNSLATWTLDKMSGGGAGPIGGIIDTTLNGSTMPFPKGVKLQQWLNNVGALGQNGVATGELSIYAPRYNSVVGASNTPSQPWITSDSTGLAGQTMYFSFDTPVGAQPGPDGGPPPYCGRAVFSDLHVAGNPATTDTCNVPSLFGFGGKPPPAGCADVDLSPQEKALEFMLFDLSSCVIPDTIAPPVMVPPPPPPQ